MKIPLTWDALKAYTAETIQSRGESLEFFIGEALTDPAEVLHSFKQDIRQVINRNEKKTQFAYEVAYLNSIYTAFGDPESVDSDIHMAMTEYQTNFPTANYTIEVAQRDADGKPVSCRVVVHFTLPWLSDQTNSHPAQPK